MISKEVTIQKTEGLHARPATFFIQKANELKSLITIEHGESSANAKSLLGVLALGIDKGMTFKITANGADEEDAVNALVHLVTSNFEE